MVFMNMLLVSDLTRPSQLAKQRFHGDEQLPAAASIRGGLLSCRAMGHGCSERAVEQAGLPAEINKTSDI